jgi:hypothetical protein
MLLVFAYPDVFGVYRTDVLDATLDGRVAATVFTVNQKAPDFHVKQHGLPILEVSLSLLLEPRARTSSPPGLEMAAASDRKLAAYATV